MNDWRPAYMQPQYLDAGYYFGQALDNFNNVVIYCNGTRDWQVNSGIPRGYCSHNRGGAGVRLCTNFQCSNLALRYFEKYQKLKLDPANTPKYNAKDFNYYASEGKGVNFVGSENIQTVKPGDILVHDGGSARSHVSVVKSVEANGVWIVQQNSNDPANYQQYISFNALPYAPHYVKGFLTPGELKMKYDDNSGKLTLYSNISVGNATLYIKRKNGDCYEDLYSFAVSGSSRDVSFGSGTYVARLVANLTAGTLQSPLYQFSVSHSRMINISGIGTYDIRTFNSINTKSSAMVARVAAAESEGTAPNITLYRLLDGEWVKCGSTDEDGRLFTDFMPALEAGETLVAEAEGYEALEGVVTQEMIDNQTIGLLMQRKATSRIVDATMRILNYQTIYSADAVELYVDAQNHTHYQVQALSDCDCEQDYADVYPANEKYALVSGLHEGENIIEVTFTSSVDTVVLHKTVYYSLGSQNDNNLLLVLSSAESIGADMYVSGVFVKRIESATESVLIPNGKQRISFAKEGYSPYFEDIDIANVINLNLQKAGETGIVQVPASESGSLVIFPNPASAEFTLLLDNAGSQPFHVSVYNVHGQIVEEQIVAESRPVFNFGRKPKGIYLVRVTDADGLSMTGKIILK
jgi:hypothetical protein